MRKIKGKILFVLVVASIIGSGLLGVVISIVYYRRHENSLGKLEALRDFVGWRYTLAEGYGNLDSSLLFKALNQISIIFKTERVKRELQALHDGLVTDKRLNFDLLVRLYRAMCKEVRVKTNDFTDEFFLRPFTPTKRGS